MYVPDTRGAEETRKFIQFLAGLMNEINDVSDEQFSEVIDKIEKAMHNLLPGADMSVVGWTMYAMGFIEGKDDPMQGLFWSALGDGIIQREEAREQFGEGMFPRPERVSSPDEATVCPGCGEDHEVMDLEERMAQWREIAPMLKEQAADARKQRDRMEDGYREAVEGDPRAILRMLGLPPEIADNIEVEIINPNEVPPGASKADMLRYLAEREERKIDTRAAEVTGDDGPDFDAFLRELDGSTGDTEGRPEGDETPPQG